MTALDQTSVSPVSRGALPAIDAIPRAYEESRAGSGGDPIASAGLNQASAFKASLWRYDFSGTVTTYDPDFICLVHHRGGGMAWFDGLKRGPSSTETVGVHDWRAAEQHWHCDGEVSYSHFYIPRSVIKHVSQDLFDAEDALGDPEQVWGTRNRRMLNVMRTAADTLLVGPPPSRLLLDAWGVVFSETLLREFFVRGEPAPFATLAKPPPKSIARVIDYIEAHLDEDLSLAALADVAAMSLYHFARRFREAVGVSPHAYVMARRVERAKDLLRHANDNLAAVAHACGFSSQSHFTTVFREHTGATPGRFRRDVNE